MTRSSRNLAGTWPLDAPLPFGDTVTQALENLRTDERIVGIVSHLPQLAERLPAQIRVVKSQADSHVEVVSD